MRHVLEPRPTNPVERRGKSKTMQFPGRRWPQLFRTDVVRRDGFLEPTMCAFMRCVLYYPVFTEQEVETLEKELRTSVHKL